MFILLCLPSGCGHPFGSIVSFVTIDRERRFPLEVVSCTMSPPISGLCSRFPMSSVGLSGLLVAGDHAFTGLVTVLSSTLGPVVFLVFTLCPLSQVGSVGFSLLLCPGFLFSGPGWCGRLPPCSFSSVFLRDVVTLSGL